MQYPSMNNNIDQSTKKFIEFGKYLLNQKENMKKEHGSTYGRWGKYLRETYGKKFSSCNHAMFLAKRDIKPSQYKLGIRALLKVSRGIPYPEHLTPIQKDYKSIKGIRKFKNGKNHNKRYIESFYLRVISSWISIARLPCLIISGPDYSRHVKNAFHFGVAGTVTIAEHDNKYFNHIMSQARRCSFYNDNRVSLFNGDVKDLGPYYKYQDLDLMKSFSNTFHIIKHRLSEQAVAFPSQDYSMENFFSFTVSLRSKSKTDNFNYMKKLFSVLECDLIGFDGVEKGYGTGVKNNHNKTAERAYCVKHHPNFTSGRVQDCIYYHYKDTAPMLSCMFIYK